MYTDPSHEFCSNLYYKIQKESAVIEDTVQTLISIMQKEILSIKTSIKDLDKVGVYKLLEYKYYKV